MSNKRIKDLQEGSLSSTTYLPIDSVGGGTRRLATSLFALRPSSATSGNVCEFDSNGDPIDSGIVADDVAIRDTDAVSGNIAKFDATGNPVDSSIPSTSIGDLGNAIGMRAWNQLVSSSTSSVTLTSGHKYITRIGGTDSLVTGTGTAVSVTGGTDNVIDLTALFGSGNEPATVAEFRAMFPASYYPWCPIQPTFYDETSTTIKANGKYVDATGVWDSTKERTQVDINSGALYFHAVTSSATNRYVCIEATGGYQTFFGFGQKGILFALNNMNGEALQQTFLTSDENVTSFVMVDSRTLKMYAATNTYVYVYSPGPFTLYAQST